MAKKVILKNNGESFYPVTLANSVFNEKGEFLSNKLELLNIDSSLSRMQKVLDDLNKVNTDFVPNIQPNENSSGGDTDESEDTMPSILYIIQNGSFVNANLIGTGQESVLFEQTILTQSVVTLSCTTTYPITFVSFNKAIDLTKYSSITVEYKYTQEGVATTFGVFAHNEYLYTNVWNESSVAVRQKYVLNSTLVSTVNKTIYTCPCNFSALSNYIGLYLVKEDTSVNQTVNITNLYLS